MTRLASLFSPLARDLPGPAPAATDATDSDTSYTAFCDICRARRLFRLLAYVCGRAVYGCSGNCGKVCGG